MLVVGADDRENEWIGEGVPYEERGDCENRMAKILSSSRGALCHQQDSPGPWAESYQYGQSYGPHEVRDLRRVIVLREADCGTGRRSMRREES